MGTCRRSSLTTCTWGPTRAPPLAGPSWAPPRTSSPSPGTTWSITSRPITRVPAWCSLELAVLTMESCANWLRRTLAKLVLMFPMRLLLTCTAGTLDLMCESATTQCLLLTLPLLSRVAAGLTQTTSLSWWLTLRHGQAEPGEHDVQHPARV